MNPLPEIPLAKVLAGHRQESGFLQLRVFVYELPFEGHITKQTRDFSVYLPPPERGGLRATVPELGPSTYSLNSERCLLIPPNVPARIESMKSNSRVTHFVYSPLLLEATATYLGVQGLLSKRTLPSVFVLDQRLRTLCQLLVEETENRYQLGPQYFEGLARASAVGLLRALCDPHAEQRPAVPPGIRRAIDWLEEHSAQDICATALAEYRRPQSATFRALLSTCHRLYAAPVSREIVPPPRPEDHRNAKRWHVACTARRCMRF